MMQALQMVGLQRQKNGKGNLVNVATYEDRDFQAVESNSLWLTDIKSGLPPAPLQLLGAKMCNYIIPKFSDFHRGESVK